MALAQAEPPEIARTNRDSKNLTKLIVATSVGNALATIRQSLLLTFGTFGVAFLIRPIGGVLLGSYADRDGRKASLMVSIVMMTFATLAVALMPTFLGIGVLAPLAVVVARLLQGFSAGGEFGSSTALLVGHMPHRRGFVASFQLQASASAACLGRGVELHQVRQCASSAPVAGSSALRERALAMIRSPCCSTSRPLGA